MILIETYDSNNHTAMHTQTCDGIRFDCRTLARLNDLSDRILFNAPIIKEFVTHLHGGFRREGETKYPVQLTIPEGGRLLMCYCEEDTNGRIL
jgi:hypothetical protein